MPLDEARLRAWKFEPVRQRYSASETILYALSIGLGTDPVNPRELPFVYEEGLRAWPAMATILGSAGFWQQDPATGITASVAEKPSPSIPQNRKFMGSCRKRRRPPRAAGRDFGRAPCRAG